MKKVIVCGAILAVMVLAAALALPAQADGPEQYTLSWEEHFPVEGMCNFTLMVDTYSRIKYIEWFDDEGNLVKQFQNWGQSRFVITNPVTGRSLKAKVTGSAHVEVLGPDLLLIKDTGPVFFTVVPGHGPAIGRPNLYIYKLNLITWEEEVVKSSVHFSYDEEDLQAICSYLAGE